MKRPTPSPKLTWLQRGRCPLVLTFIFFLLVSSLEAAPYSKGVLPSSRSTGVQESIGELRHDVDNHEIEIKMVEERLNTQEVIVDSLRQQLLDDRQAHKELIKGNSVSADTRLAGIDTALTKISGDIRLLQSHCNDSSKALIQYKTKIEELEKNIENLQSALQSILASLEGDAVKGNDKMHEVKTGDSLEKIARKHQTTVQKIKEVNGLKNDKIFIGQQLKMP